jgi:plastocyanin
VSARAAWATAAFCAALLAPQGRAAEIDLAAFDREGKPLANVIVYAVPLGGAAPRPPARTITVEQRGMEFAPYVNAVAVGWSVEFPNMDKTTHHVKSFSAAKEFEFFMGSDKPASSTVLFDKPGPVIVYCMLHDWMRTYVYVVDSAWFAKTSEAGVGKIVDLPDGSYKLTAWHPDLGAVGTPLTQNITVKGTSKARFDFALTPRKPRAPKVVPKA